MADANADDRAPWVDDDAVALFTDLYQLTMLQAFWRERMFDDAVFTLFVRRLPQTRNYLLACGLDDVLRGLERLRFRGEHLDFIRNRAEFRPEFVEWLADYRFSGRVRAVPEGTPVFADEPILEVVAPLPEAQLVETFIMNQVHVQTALASKAARVVEAARGRAVIDFGMRRMHGTDAAMKAARAFHVAGVDATSNVLAGMVYGIPIAGTMAHSYVQAHDSEADAFRRFTELYPDSILLVDTYDTLDGVRTVIALARELGSDFRVRGIRLDSGDLASLAFRTRALLDEAGLDHVEVFASGGLDESDVDQIVRMGAPIAGFGVGTSMGVSRDAPALDIAYKLSEYGGRGRLKLSPGKPILPGHKQVFRIEQDGRAVHDVIARADERLDGRPLMTEVMRKGRRTGAARDHLDTMRSRARREIDALPAAIRALEPPAEPFPVRISSELARYRDAVTEQVRG